MASISKSAALVVMLVLAALAVSAQADSCWVENKTPAKMKCNDVDVYPGESKQITLDANLRLLVILILGKDGKWQKGECKVPKDVLKLAVYLSADGLSVVLKVVAVVGGLLSQLIGTLLGAVLLVIKLTVKLGV